MNAHIQDGHAFRPQCLGQRVRCGGYLTDLLHLERHLILYLWLLTIGRSPNGTECLVDGSLAHVPARSAAARRAGQALCARKAHDAQSGGGLAGVHGDRITNGDRLYVLVAILQHDLTHARIAPARQLKRRDGYVLEVRIADNIDGHVSGRSVDVPLGRHDRLHLHRLHVRNSRKLRCQRRVKPIHHQCQIRGVRGCARAVSKGGQKGLLNERDARQAQHTDEDAQHDHQRAPLAPRHIRERLFQAGAHERTSGEEAISAFAPCCPTMRPSSRSRRAWARAARLGSWVT